jgi:hypothetical protein
MDTNKSVQIDLNKNGENDIIKQGFPSFSNGQPGSAVNLTFSDAGQPPFLELTYTPSVAFNPNVPVDQVSIGVTGEVTDDTLTQLENAYGIEALPDTTNPTIITPIKPKLRTDTANFDSRLASVIDAMFESSANPKSRLKW